MTEYKAFFGPVYPFGHTLCLQGDVLKLNCGTKLYDERGNETVISSFALSSGNTRRDTVSVVCKTTSPPNTDRLFIK